MFSPIYPFSMALVRENYTKLQNSISDLGSNLNTILQKQEEDFLLAYRTHMRNVQKDFDSLQSEIDEKEKAIANNLLVKQIEKERDWYKKEALHLDQVVLKFKKRDKTLTEKVEELEQERTWLSNQLKLVMKQKNSLETRIDEVENRVNDEVVSNNICMGRIET
jgi:chromosome segregation ATPase